MENFANEFVSKLDGKISDEALRTVLQELQVFASNYDINQRETACGSVSKQCPRLLQGLHGGQKRLRACLQNP